MKSKATSITNLVEKKDILAPKEQSEIKGGRRSGEYCIDY